MKDDTIRRQWLMECVEERWIKFDTQEDENRFVHLIRDIAPSARPTVNAVPVSWIMAQVEERKARGTAFDTSVASILRTMMKEWKDGQTD